MLVTGTKEGSESSPKVVWIWRDGRPKEGNRVLYRRTYPDGELIEYLRKNLSRQWTHKILKKAREKQCSETAETWKAALHTYLSSIFSPVLLSLRRLCSCEIIPEWFRGSFWLRQAGSSLLKRRSQTEAHSGRDCWPRVQAHSTAPLAIIAEDKPMWPT